MPAPIAQSKTAAYWSLSEQSAARGEHNDCTVKALAVACNVSYDDAHQALEANGRKHRDGAYFHTIRAAVEQLGYKLNVIDPAGIIASYPKPHCDKLKNVTTHHPDRFASVWPKGTFLLFPAGHVAAIVDGQNHDWTRGRANRVQSMYEVVEKD